MQHQEPEEPDKTALAVVDYPRRRRKPSVTFAGWFVTIGAINLLFGSLTFAATCLRLSTVAVTWLKGPSGIFQFPLTDLIMGAFMLLASGLIVGGQFRFVLAQALVSKTGPQWVGGGVDHSHRRRRGSSVLPRSAAQWPADYDYSLDHHRTNDLRGHFALAV